MRQIKLLCPFQRDGFLLKIYLWTVKGSKEEMRAGDVEFVSIKIIVLRRVVSYQSLFLGLFYL